MLRKQRIIEDKQATIYFDAPEGRASAATVTVKTALGQDLPDSAVEDESATIDSVSTTIAAGWDSDDPRSIPVASATGITVDRDYLITTAGGRTEWVRVVAISGSDLTVQSTPGFDLTTGDAFVGTRLTYVITAANAADRAHDYRAVWEYTVSSIAYDGENVYDVVRTPPKNPANTAGLRKYAPELVNEWNEILDENYDLQDRIDDAFDRVIVSMQSRSPDDNTWADAIVQWSQCERSVYERVLLDLALAGYIPPAFNEQGDIWIDRRELEYKEAIEEWTRKIIWYDANDDRIQGAGEEGKNLWSVRLVP